MATRKVFIFWTHPLFHDAMRALLNHPGIEWVGSSSNYSAAKSQLGHCLADTVVVEEVEGNFPTDILQHLESNNPQARVVGLNFEDNQFRLYRRIQRTVGKAEDLLNWILND